MFTTVNYAIMLSMSTSQRSTYHHGHLRPALIAAARALLDEGGPGAVGLREAARRVGVSPTATYRHFRDKDDSARRRGRRGVPRIRRGARRGRTPRRAAFGDGRGLCRFRAGAARHVPADVLAADGQARALSGIAGRRGRGVRAAAPRRPVPSAARPRSFDAAAIAAWSLVHGLSHLILDGVLPAGERRGVQERDPDAAGEDAAAA